MQGAGQRSNSKRQAAANGGGEKHLKEQAQKVKQPPFKKQKRSSSDVAAAPAAKKRRSAPELPKGGGQGHATPVAPARSAYNLRTRSSMPAAGTRSTDGSLPVSGNLPSSVRPRNPNQKASWNELPDEVLKIICQHLDSSTVFVARGVSAGMRDACSNVPVQLKFMLPMQSSPWMPVQLEAWERRVIGVAGMLSSGKMKSNSLELRMEGVRAWRIGRDDESLSAAQISNAVQHLLPLLNTLQKMGSLAAAPITHLDVELPVTMDTMVALKLSFPNITSLCLDSLVSPPYNHAMILSESRAFTGLRKLDISLRAWDQLQCLSSLTQLTELKIRYIMWNIPELSPLVSLQQLTTFSIEVLDSRARFQLDFLGPLVRGVPSLRHLRASVVLSRTVVSESGPASCDFLAGSSLKTLDLDVRVPRDAARMVQGHFRNLHLAPQGCKVNLTIRSEALMRETSFESAGTACGLIIAPRVGMAMPQPPEPRERWAALNMELGGHPPGALALHLQGYIVPLTTLPDMSAARLTRLQVSHSRLCAADFSALAGCTTLEQLFIRFTYLPDPADSGARVRCADPPGATLRASSEGAKPPAMPTVPTGRTAVSARHVMVTRSRKSLQAAGGCSGVSAGVGVGASSPVALPPKQLDCTTGAVPFILKPLLLLRKLRCLELLEERDWAWTCMARRAAAAATAAGAARAKAATTGSTSTLTRQRIGSASAVSSDSDSDESMSPPPPPPPYSDPLLPLSRVGLCHFLTNLRHLPQIKAVSLAFLVEEEALPDCPCRPPCFSPGTKGKKPPPPLDEMFIRERLPTSCKYKFCLGEGLIAQSPDWYRPSTWPELSDDL